MRQAQLQDGVAIALRVGGLAPAVKPCSVPGRVRPRPAQGAADDAGSFRLNLIGTWARGSAGFSVGITIGTPTGAAPPPSVIKGVVPDVIGLDERDAIVALKEAGFRNTDISVLFPENTGTKDFAHEKNTKAPEGAATGAGSGAVIGGTLGWLVGIGVLAIPGLGPFIAAGPLMSALAGVGAGGVAVSLAPRLRVCEQIPPPLWCAKRTLRKTPENRRVRSAHHSLRS